VRIDQSDLADEPHDAHMARRARSIPDEPDATGKDQGNAGGSDSPPGSSPAPPESALPIERAAAYRAAVDAAYRQDAIDHDYARAEKPERETVTLAMRRIEAEDLEHHLVGLENRSNDGDRPAEAEHGIRVWERTTAFHPVAQMASGDAYHSVAETTPLFVPNAIGLGYPTVGTAADDVRTGARGPTSGREFDPEMAGGPIQQLIRRRESENHQ
jgi:hypothetical protein